MPAPSPATMPVRFLSNGRLALVGIAILGGHLFGLQRVDRLHRQNARAGGAGDHQVGVAALDRAKRFADGQVAGRFAHGERVVRAAEVVVDGDVAGRHVGQILEHPQRGHVAEAFFAPAREFEVAGRRTRLHAALRSPPAS